MDTVGVKQASQGLLVVGIITKKKKDFKKKDKKEKTISLV